jgi:hypothetical protein
MDNVVVTLPLSLLQSWEMKCSFWYATTYSLEECFCVVSEPGVLVLCVCAHAVTLKNLNGWGQRGKP